MRDVIAHGGAAAVAAGGFLIGLVFGAIVYRTNFCTMGSISDFVTFGDFRRFRSWILASTVALIGTQSIAALGVVSLTQSMYLGSGFNWLGYTAGGLMFGFGMVLAGGCASKNLVRAGGGDLRALVVLLVVGFASYVAIGGLLGPIRASLEQWTAIELGTFGLKTQGFGELAAKFAGVTRERADLWMTAALATAGLAYCIKDPGFRSSPMHLLGGIGVGLCVVAGWALTGLAFDEMAARPVPTQSLTFVRPTGDTIEWLQRFTAQPMPGFGIATVLGTVTGSGIAAVSSGRFRVTGFGGAADTGRSLAGAVLMGFGGVLALGCTVGQAIAGVSTLALGSFVTFAAIVFGGIQGMRYMERVS